jgi:hypothetical protein
MDQPTDPLARQLALSALTTEQFNLQTARMGTIAEANGRSTLYLGTLSSAVIALAFVGQASQLGDAFCLFALTLLPPVFLLGVLNRSGDRQLNQALHLVVLTRLRYDPATRAYAQRRRAQASPTARSDAAWSATLPVSCSDCWSAKQAAGSWFDTRSRTGTTPRQQAGPRRLAAVFEEAWMS